MARNLLMLGIVALAAGCAGSPAWMDRGPSLPNGVGTHLADMPEAARPEPIHVTEAGETSESAEKFGFRGMWGIMVDATARPGGLDPVDGTAFEADADYPVFVTDLNFTDELDENFSFEIMVGSIFFGDGFRAQMPAGGDPGRYELRASNHFFIIGGTALFRIGSGRLGKFYGGPGLNLYVNNIPGKEESIKFTGMVAWRIQSWEHWSLSIDAKYWKMGFGNLQYLLIGANLSRAF